MLADEIKIGDKVVAKNQYQKSIGEVIKITAKRKDITVQFSNYTLTFDQRGWEKGGSVWNRIYIEKLTPDVEEEIRNSILKQKCINMFEKRKNDLTVEQVNAILNILNENGENK